MDHPNAGERPVPSNRGDARPSGASRWGALALVLLLFGLGFFGASRIARTAEKSAVDQGTAAPVQTSAAAAPAGVSVVFTPAHRTFFGAVKEFLLWQSTPVQPIAFNHKIHIQHGLQCTSCHAGASQGPDAGIPSVSFCMACHQVIATDKPEIKNLSAYAAKGQEPPWQRVFWFYPSVHVKFWHAPHIRAGVSCEQCHGDIAQETVAVETKDLTMKFCLSCHNAKGVSVDCTTCHY
jgi:Cytochrome c7 and related cytochrome c